MHELQPLHASREIGPTPESLSDVRLGELLAAVGNHEGKALLILAMDAASQAEMYYTRGGLNDLLLNLPGSENAYLGNRGNQVAWCKGSLGPIGLVAKERHIGAERYAITEEGRCMGAPLAALLLDFSERHGTALEEIFGGSVSSTKMRAPLIRLRMMTEILTSPRGICLSDLVETTGVASQTVLGKHLHKLSIGGLLEYDDWNLAINENRYIKGKKPYPGHGLMGSWVPTIIEHLEGSEERPVSLDNLIDFCRATKPHLARGIDEKQLRDQITETLHYLKKKELISQVEGRTHNQTLKISLTTEQEEFWVELLNILDAFSDHSPSLLSRGKALASQILRDPDMIANLLNRSAEASAHSRNSAKKDLGSVVLGVLRAAKKPLSVRELVEQVSEKQGRTASREGVNKIVKRLAEEGQATESTDKVQRYEITPATT
jgi:hypothetical protein